MLLLIGLFAWLTYPKLDDVAQLAEDGKQLDAYREYQAAWFGQIKDLIQLLVTVLVALLSNIIGYIFGRNAEAQS